MVTLKKRIETLEQYDHSQDTTYALLRHLGVDVPMPTKTQSREIKPHSLDDELIASLIRGAELARGGQGDCIGNSPCILPASQKCSILPQALLIDFSGEE